MSKMKRLVILILVALAIDLGFASAMMRYGSEDRIVGEPKIIGIDVDEAGLYKNGRISVHVQNTGEEAETFDIETWGCYPLDYNTEPAVKLLPGEIRVLSVPLRMGPYIENINGIKVDGIEDERGTGCSALFYNNTTPKLENEKLCMPNSLYIDKYFVKRCNEFGTDSDVIASCKRNITCEVIIYNKITGFNEGNAYGNFTFELEKDAVCVPYKFIGHATAIHTCDDSSKYKLCHHGAVYDKEQGDFICLQPPKEKSKYKNIDDPDCDDAFNYFDADLNACVQKPNCPNVITNGNPEQKIDVVFVGDGYSSDKELKQDVLKIVGSDGLMSVEPFKSNRDKFNVWMINAGDRIPEDYADLDGGPDRSTSLEVASGCPFVDYQVILSKKSFRSYAFFSGDAYLSLGATPENEWGRLFLHEFGHSFGKLADEYVEPRLGNWPRQPNCAPNAETARDWWSGVPGTAFYDGCSYTETNVRPAFNSIMRDHWVLKDGYGEVNKAALLKLLNKYAG